jgi:hypothetical protein
MGDRPGGKYRQGVCFDIKEGRGVKRMPQLEGLDHRLRQGTRCATGESSDRNGYHANCRNKCKCAQALQFNRYNLCDRHRESKVVHYDEARLLRVRGGSEAAGKIRFPLMEEGYLRSRVVRMDLAEDAAWMEGMVAKALQAKAARWDREGFN